MKKPDKVKIISIILAFVSAIMICCIVCITSFEAYVYSSNFYLRMPSYDFVQESMSETDLKKVYQSIAEYLSTDNESALELKVTINDEITDAFNQNDIALLKTVRSKLALFNILRWMFLLALIAAVVFMGIKFKRNGIRIYSKTLLIFLIALLAVIFFLTMNIEKIIAFLADYLQIESFDFGRAFNIAFPYHQVLEVYSCPELGIFITNWRRLFIAIYFFFILISFLFSFKKKNKDEDNDIFFYQ